MRHAYAIRTVNEGGLSYLCWCRHFFLITKIMAACQQSDSITKLAEIRLGLIMPDHAHQVYANHI